MADSPLKITLPANLPRNEKDLICMLLAGRLKDLFKGKLICAQLAIDDLIKQTTGVSALGALQANLLKMKSSLNNLKSISGYDNILSKVNQALGQVSNVFSLGGLCPSPVQAPKIPDVLAQLNQNLFGQANNILNALTFASNPSLCLGNGPNGFGLDWSKVTGDLKNLRNAIEAFKADPANGKKTMAQFQANLKAQNSRLNSEFKRLRDNLADPLGINEKQNTARNIQRFDAVTGDVPVKDRNGIEYKNTLRLMNPGDIDYVIGRREPQYTTPIKYVVSPVYDYCGVITGYETKAVSGDPEFVGWITDPVYYDIVNTNKPTPLPSPTFSQYDYSIVEINGAIKVYDNTNSTVSVIKLERGKHYRIHIALTTASIKFYDGNNVWTSGLTFSKTPDYGNGLDIVAPTTDTAFTYGEIDWAVSIENPTTPNVLSWSGSGQSGIITIEGISVLAEEDKSYDLAMAFRKSWLSLTTRTSPVTYEVRAQGRQYSINTEITSPDGNFSGSSSLSYSAAIGPGTYQVVNDNETLDYDTGKTDPGNKIIIMTQSVGGQTLTIKRYVNVDSGLGFNQLSCYLTNGSTITPLVALKNDNTLTVSNDTKLPFNSTYNYSLVMPYDAKITSSHKTKVEVNGNKFKWSLSDNTSEAELPTSEFIYTSEVEFDAGDTNRSYVTTECRESKIFMYFKGPNGFSFKSTITYTGEGSAGGLAAITTTKHVVLNQKVETPPIIPVTAQGGNPLYFYSVTPDLPLGLKLDPDTGELTGSPEEYTKSLDQAKPDAFIVTIKDESSAVAKAKFTLFIAKIGADIKFGIPSDSLLAFAPPVAPAASTLSGTQLASEFVTGGGGSLQTPPPGAVIGKDYAYLNLPWSANPVYVDLTQETPDQVVAGPLTVGSGISRTYTIEGVQYQTLQQYSLEEYNPELATFGTLPKSERMAIVKEYTTANDLVFMTSGVVDSINTYESEAFRSFLKTKL